MTHPCRAGLCALILMAIAPVPAAAAPAGPAEAVASCLVTRSPQGGRLFRASDGSLRVLAIGRRGAIARWTVPADGSAAIRRGGMAGLDRTVTEPCRAG